MNYNVRDRKGRFTKVRHSERDSETGRFVSRTVAKHSLRDEFGRFRSAKKYSVRNEQGRFTDYRHNVRDEVTGRFVSAKKGFNFTNDELDEWEFEFDSLTDSEDDFWGPCECDGETNCDVDDDGTPFCTECLGDVDLDKPSEEVDDFDYAQLARDAGLEDEDELVIIAIVI